MYLHQTRDLRWRGGRKWTRYVSGKILGHQQIPYSISIVEFWTSFSREQNSRRIFRWRQALQSCLLRRLHYFGSESPRAVYPWLPSQTFSLFLAANARRLMAALIRTRALFHYRFLPYILYSWQQTKRQFHAIQRKVTSVTLDWYATRCRELSTYWRGYHRCRLSSAIDYCQSGCDMEQECYVRFKTCFIYINSSSMWMCRMWKVLITCSISWQGGFVFFKCVWNLLSQGHFC